MSKIKKIIGREILDSRGNPTVEAEVYLDTGLMTKAAVPSGASTGKYEAVELRDGDEDRYVGKGVLKAVANINEDINDELVGRDVGNQKKIDWLLKELDGSDNKGRLGANAILAVSMATVRAAALVEGKPLYEQISQTFGFNSNYQLPTPYFNIVNGGEHASNKLSIQEFMLVPVIDGNFEDKLRLGAEVYHQLKEIIESKGQPTTVGDEGGFAPNIDDPGQVLELIIEAGEKAGYKQVEDFAIALDVAASEFSSNDSGNFNYLMEGFDSLDSKGMSNYLLELASNYPIISIEDPLDQEDWQGWQYFTSKAPDSLAVVGDDLFVTNKDLLSKGIKLKAGNSILIKLNQIGTVSETVETIKQAQQANYDFMVSHRSGETSDSFIADFVVGVGGSKIKSGSLSRSDRLSKYNQLLRIEDKIYG